jgi:hypothetical protein
VGSALKRPRRRRRLHEGTAPRWTLTRELRWTRRRQARGNGTQNVVSSRPRPPKNFCLTGAAAIHGWRPWVTSPFGSCAFAAGGTTRARWVVRAYSKDAVRLDETRAVLPPERIKKPAPQHLCPGRTSPRPVRLVARPLWPSASGPVKEPCNWPRRPGENDSGWRPTLRCDDDVLIAVTGVDDRGETRLAALRAHRGQEEHGATGEGAARDLSAVATEVRDLRRGHRREGGAGVWVGHGLHRTRLVGPTRRRGASTGQARRDERAPIGQPRRRSSYARSARCGAGGRWRVCGRSVT